MGNKISITMHAFCDENDFNAQNLNAREIACRLNPNLFEVTLFYCTNRPDGRLRNKENIHLIKVPNYKESPSKAIAFFSVLRHLLGRYDIFFYVRNMRLDLYYFKIRKFFRDKKNTVHTIENPLPHLDCSEYYKKLARLTTIQSDYVYSISKYVAETAEKHYGIKTPIIYVGVDTNAFQPSKNKKEDTEKAKVLYVGSFQQRKRPYLVIQAARLFPEVEFHLIGRGPLEYSLLRAKEKFRTDNVYFHKHVPLQRLVSWMQEADVFLFPSIHEGFGKVTIEAAATGLPAIVFNNYKPETVLNGETGFIIRDVDEMMEKLAILIEDADLRRKMGERAREYAKRFDWNIITNQWEKEFLKMVTVKAY